MFNFTVMVFSVFCSTLLSLGGCMSLCLVRLVSKASLRVLF
jgi:hypothetical protein